MTRSDLRRSGGCRAGEQVGRGLALGALGLLLVTPLAHAQETLARRVAAVAGDAEVRFASRPDVCGDGAQMISFRSFTMVREMTIAGHGDWRERCMPGPVRVRLSVADGAVTRVHTYIGAGGGRSSPVTDLGVVGTRDAVEYLLGLARGGSVGSRVAADAILPAALADSTTISPALVALARDRGRPMEVRKRALFWAGEVGEPGVLEPVRAIARDSTDERTMREHAVFVLSQLRDDGGVPALIDIVRANRDPWLAKKATFWLGQSDAPQAHETLRTLVTDPAVSEEVKGEAVFVLGQHEDDTEDQAFLRDHFDALPSDRLRERVLMGVGQNGGAEGASWLFGVARDDARSLRVRKQALFWAGQGDTPTSGFVDLYRQLHDRELQKQVIFVLSQRADSSATDALMDIARSDGDHELRKQAMFWLGQKDDPRVAKFLASILEH